MKVALRQLLKSPGFTIVALITLALGIGVNTTAFTVLNRFLLQSLPFKEPNRLVQIWGSSAQAPYISQTPGDYFDLRDHNTVFEGVAAYYADRLASLSEPGEGAVRCTAMKVTPEFFPLFGLRPSTGRIFTAEDQARHEPLAVLSNAYWIKHYHADPQVLGKTLRINNTSLTIIGIMPPFLDDEMVFNNAIDLWSLDDIEVNRNFRENGWYTVAARLKTGVTLQQAQAEMTGLAKSLSHDFPKTNAGRNFNVIAYPSDSMGETGSRLIWMIMALSGGVLLIACVNLANLQLVRTTSRSQEISIRLALGVSRSQLIGMLLKESLILALAGGALGLLVAKWSNYYVATFLHLDMPLGFRVLGFAFIIASLTGALFGTIPAWMASRTDVDTALKQGGRGGTSDRSRHRFRQTLVVVELAMALTLMAGAGYFVRGIQRLSDRQLGWKPEHLLVGYFALDHDRYGEEGDPRSLTFSEHLYSELTALPGVDQAVFSRNSPVWGFGDAAFVVEGSLPVTVGHETYANAERISPGFFNTYGIPLLQGRDFTAADRVGSPNVAIINASIAQQYWPNQNPIGKRLGENNPAAPNWAEVIGVVGDITASGDLRPHTSRAIIYKPWAQKSHRFITFTLHSAQDPATLIETVRKTFAKLDSSIAITQLDDAKTMMASQFAGFSLVRRLLIQIAVLGLLLATVGIYGVIANLAAERVKEIGIRVALGAQPRDVIMLFLRNGIRLALIGGVIGLACAFALMTLLNKMIDVVPGNDPWVVIAVFILLLSAALLACWLPAFRATKVNPMVALQP